MLFIERGVCSTIRYRPQVLGLLLQRRPQERTPNLWKQPHKHRPPPCSSRHCLAPGTLHPADRATLGCSGGLVSVYRVGIGLYGAISGLAESTEHLSRGLLLKLKSFWARLSPRIPVTRVSACLNFASSSKREGEAEGGPLESPSQGAHKPGTRAPQVCEWG